MAVIKVEGDLGTVLLSEPDEDTGTHIWTCLTCGEAEDVWYPIADAEVHVDLNCPGPR